MKIKCLNLIFYRRFRMNKYLDTADKPIIGKIHNKFKFQNSVKSRDDKIFDDNEIRVISGDLLEQSESRVRKQPMYFQKRKQRLPVIGYKGEILYGLHPVYLALMKKKRTFYEIFIKKPSLLSYEDNKNNLRDEIIKLGLSLGVKFTEVTSQDLRYIAPNAVHQGICMDASRYPVLEHEEINKEELNSKLPVWLILDKIQDPMNVGAILRSAYYFGIDKIFITIDFSCKLTPTVSKASSGALELSDIYHVDDIVSFLQKKKDENWEIISTTAYESISDTEKKTNAITDLTKISITKPTILILGNEALGSSESVKSLCNYLISIYPCRTLHTGVDSLNVSVAAGILFYHLLYTRKSSATSYQ